MNSTPRPAAGRRRSWWNTPSRRREEGGFAAIMLMVAGTLVGFAILMLWAVPLFVATDGQARNQTAADAAAIAAAESVRLPTGVIDGLVGFNGDLESFAPLFQALTGEAEATRFATQYDDTSRITYFDYSNLTATVEVETMVDGKLQRSKASARLDLPSCSSREEEVPPEPEEDPDPADGEGDADADEGDADADEGDEDDTPPEPEKVNVWTCAGIKLNDPQGTLNVAELINTIVTKSSAKLVD